MSRTVFEAWRSRTVEVTPAGLWRRMYSGADAAPMTLPSTAMTALSGSTCIPSLAGLPSTVTRPLAIEHLARPTRRDARRGEDLLEALGGHQPVRARRSSGNSGSVTGSPPSSARRAATSASSGGSSSRLVSPNRSRNSKPVPYRNGRPGALDRPSSTTKPPVKQRPDRVVRVDAADALDRRLRHGLAVGDDRQRLERCRRQPDRVGADVARDERAAFGRGRELDPVAVDQQPDAAVPQRHLEVAEPGVDGRPVRAGERRDLAARQRLLGDEQEGLEGGLGQLDRGRAAGRTVGAAPSVLGRRVALDVDGRRSARPRSLMRTTPAISSIGASAAMASTPAAARSSGVVVAGDDRTPRLGLLDDDLASLHELEHRQERDRDDDPVADARRAGPGGRPRGASRRAARMISARSVMRDRPAHRLGRRLGRRRDRGQPGERPDEPCRVERRRVRPAGRRPARRHAPRTARAGTGRSARGARRPGAGRRRGRRDRRAGGRAARPRGRRLRRPARSGRSGRSGAAASPGS